MRGYLTVFLALSVSLLTGFVLLLTGNAIRNGVRVRYECAVDTGMNAVLSEFHIGLLERYDLIYIDASYLEKEPAIANVEGRLGYYIEENTSAVLGERDSPWGNLAFEKVTIPSFETAAADLGLSMRSQAVCYVEDAGISGKEGEVFGQMNEIRALQRSSPLAQWSSIMEQLAGMELPLIQNEEGEWQEVSLSNPADWVYGLVGSDVLFLAQADLSSVSPAKVSLGEYISHRQIENTDSKERDYRDDEDLFLSYLFDKMGYFGNPREDSFLSCQLEYIAKGKDSDLENVKAVAGALFELRFADNAACALADGDLRAQAVAAAEMLQAVQLKAEFKEPVAESILYACAFLESIGDLRTIYAGGCVPVRKEGHVMSVSRVLGGELYGSSGAGGWDYGQYLASMVLLAGEKNMNLRAMDIMEMDIRLRDSNKNFRMDWCIERYEAEVTARGSYLSHYFIRRKYGYF